MSKKIAIIISTKNRLGFLIKLLRFYAELKSEHTLYIADASDSKHLIEVSALIKSFSGIIDIVYKNMPEYGKGQIDNLKAVGKMLEYVKEDYAVFSGDDDYFLPKSLDKCVDFLENNPDYSSAHGNGTYIKYNKAKKKNIIRGRYIINAYNGDSASERLKMVSNKYSVLLFSVHRTNIFKRAFRNCDLLKSVMFSEFLPVCMSAVLGNSNKLNELYLIRGLHEKRDIQKTLTEKILDPQWQESLQVYLNTLSEEIRKVDGIDEIESIEIVKQDFNEILKNIIKKKYCKNDTLSDKFKQSIPLSIKKFIRNSIFPNDHYDRTGQLSKVSPYYYEFKSLLDNVNKMGEE